MELNISSPQLSAAANRIGLLKQTQKLSELSRQLKQHNLMNSTTTKYDFFHLSTIVDYAGFLFICL